MNIKKIIEDSGLTVRDFAKKIYVSERTVWKWISGSKIPMTRQRQIDDFAKTMNSDRPREINWKEIRTNFFRECATETPRAYDQKKVAMSAHNLFEWFKGEVSEYL